MIRGMKNPLILAAVRLGFKKVYESVAGGDPIKSYEKAVDSRRNLIIQFWGSGLNRVSSDFLGCSDTAPTEFSDLAGMNAAILHESTRMDSKWCKPGSLATEAAK